MANKNKRGSIKFRLASRSAEYSWMVRDNEDWTCLYSARFGSWDEFVEGATEYFKETDPDDLLKRFRSNNANWQKGEEDWRIEISDIVVVVYARGASYRFERDSEEYASYEIEEVFDVMGGSLLKGEADRAQLERDATRVADIVNSAIYTLEETRLRNLREA